MQNIPEPVPTGPLELRDLSPTLITAVVAVATFVYLFVRISTWSWDERAADYDVPVPEQAREGWKGCILQRPSLKVSTREHDMKGLLLELILSIR